MNASAANIPIKTDEDIAHMRAAGRLAADVLDYIESFVVVGVTTAQLDALCHEYMSFPWRDSGDSQLRAARTSALSEGDLHIRQPSGLPRGAE